MSLPLKEFEKIVETLAPKSFIMEGDFYGWLNSPPKKIDSVAVAVDLPSNLIGCSVLILHHKPLTVPEIPTFILHTPLDRCNGGCHEALLNAFGFKTFQYVKDRLGVFTETYTTSEELLQKAKETFKNVPLRYRFFKREIKKVAFFSGCGFNYFPFLKECAKLNVDAVISGDLTHKSYQFLLHNRISFIDAPHSLTEVFGVKKFAEKLSNYVKTTFIPPEVPFDVCVG